MTVQELFDYMMQEASWVAPNATPDRIEAGDPGRVLTRVGVGWSACLPNLEAAARDRCDLFITHEPCFSDFWEPDKRLRDTEWGRKRLAVLHNADMALMALHDAWDVWPRYGIRDSWAEFLGLSDPLVQRPYLPSDPEGRHVGLGLYEIPPTDLDSFARHVAARADAMGQDGVTVMGDPRTPIRRVAIGTGCWIPSFEMLELGADVLVQVFDRAFQTVTRIPLQDLGATIIVVEHSVAEKPGMRNMARFIEQTFPTISAHFYGNEPRSRIVTPDTPSPEAPPELRNRLPEA